MSTNDDDEVFHQEGAIVERALVAGVISIFMLMRAGHIGITRAMFVQSNFSSTAQWHAVLSLQIFSFTTGIFTFAFVNIHLWCLVESYTANTYSRLFYVCYALQCLNYNLWLIARDRALQSPFFHTNVYLIYIVLVLSVLSMLCNLTLYPMYAGEIQILGQLIQITIIFMMTISFIRPLIQSKNKQSVVLRDVILRTAIGAAIHVVSTCFFASLLFEGVYFEAKFGLVGFDFGLFSTTTFPTLLHIALSHRDDKPLFYVLSTSLSIISQFFCYSPDQVTPPRLNFSNYQAIAVGTFEDENNEVKRLGGLENSVSQQNNLHESIVGKGGSFNNDSIFNDSLFNSSSFTTPTMYSPMGGQVLAEDVVANSNSEYRDPDDESFWGGMW